MSKIERAKAFVKTHPTITAFAAGITVGAVGILSRDFRKQVLVMTPQEIRLLQDNGGQMKFFTKAGTLLVRTEDFVQA